LVNKTNLFKRAGNTCSTRRNKRTLNLLEITKIACNEEEMLEPATQLTWKAKKARTTKPTKQKQNKQTFSKKANPTQ
jgi:hypothetical protein